MRVRYENGSAAYDLEKFQQQKPRVRVRRPNLVVANPGAKARQRARIASAIKVVTAVVVVAAAIVAMLYSRAILTELDLLANAELKALSEAQSENTRLTAELDAKISLRNVEEYATQTLGMLAVDKSQVTYVDLSEGDKIELTSESPKLTAIDRVELALSNVKERLEQD